MAEPLACPGVVVVWSAGLPRLGAHRIPDAGLVIDTAVVPWDRQLARDHAPDHARIDMVRGRRGSSSHVEITAGRTTRVFLRGRPVGVNQLSRDAVLRLETTVLVVVDDVRPFEGVTPARDGKLVVAGSLGPIMRALDEAANAEEHVSIKGPDVVVHELARHYAAKLGSHAWFRPGGDQHLDHFLSTRQSVRTVVIELVRPLLETDVTAIHHLLETDLRFVIVRTDDHFIQWLPPALARDTLEIPRVRFDELPTTIADRVAAAVPEATVRAEAIDLLLDRVATLGEDRWSEALTRALDRWQPQRPPVLGTVDLARDFP